MRITARQTLDKITAERGIRVCDAAPVYAIADLYDRYQSYALERTRAPIWPTLLRGANTPAECPRYSDAMSVAASAALSCAKLEVLMWGFNDCVAALLGISPTIACDVIAAAVASLEKKAA